MKKQIALLLTLGLVMATLSACGPSESGDGTTAAPQTETSTTAGDHAQVTIQESVLYDEQGIKLTVKGLDDGLLGTEIRFLLENNTDKNITLTGSDVVINGITLNGYLSVDAAAGKKANGALSLADEELNQAGIEKIATVTTVGAYFYDSDSFETLHEIRINLQTSIADSHKQTVDESGDVLYAKEGITVIAKSLKESLVGESLVLLVKNDGRTDMLLQSDNVSVNDYTMNALMSDIVCSETVRFCELTLLDSELEENGIEHIDNITFTLKIIDPETFATLTTTDVLTFTVSG